MPNPKDSMWRATPELMRGTKQFQVRVLPATIAAVEKLVNEGGHVKGHVVDALVAVALKHLDELPDALETRRGHQDKPAAR